MLEEKKPHKILLFISEGKYNFSDNQVDELKK